MTPVDAIWLIFVCACVMKMYAYSHTYITCVFSHVFTIHGIRIKNTRECMCSYVHN